jgi:hypothetical protein
MPNVKHKIILSRAISVIIAVAIFFSGAAVGWQCYKKTNEYLGYTSGVEFYELTFDFMIDFFDDFNTPQLKLALFGAITSFILGLVKIFRTGKRSR